MIGNPKSIGAKRWGSGVLVGAVSALVMAVPFAGVANAAATSVTATPTTNNQAAGTDLVYQVATTGTVDNIEYTVLSDPNGAVTNSGTTAKFPAALDCGSNTTCTIPTTGTPGTATIRIFDDGPDANNQFDNGEQSSDVTGVLSGVPNAVSLSPDSATTPVGNCQKYTINATDSGGRPSASRQIDITVHVTSPSSGLTAGGVTFCNPGSGNTVTATHTPGNNSGDLTGNVMTDSSTTGNDVPGQAIFGIMSDTPLSATVTVASHDTPAATDSSTQTFTAGGAPAVTSLTVSPTTSKDYINNETIFTVTAKDANGNPVSNVTVNFGVTNGTDSTRYPADGSIDCTNNGAGATNNSGQTTCDLINQGTATTDSVVFWVNETTGAGPHTGGADTGEPQANATAQFIANPPSTDTITVACPGTDVPPCELKPGTSPVTFTATVKDNNGNPVSGVLVDFYFDNNGTAGTITPDFAQGTTGADGTASATVTDSAPTATNQIDVEAEAGNGGNGVNANLVATYTAPTPDTFTLSPTDETVTNGGTVTLTAKVVDQFGGGVSGQSITWTVSGRNAGKTGTVTTGADGTATITYTDTAVNPGSNTDTVTATDTSGPVTNGNQATSTIHYITGSTTASTISVDVSGNGGDGSAGNPCPAATGSSTTKSVALGSSNDVCAIVKNSAGEALAGKTVTITVSQGTITQVNGGTAGIATDGMSATTQTNANGVVTATVKSNSSGDQTITFTADSVSGTGTLTYAAPASSAARNVSLAPDKQSITPGGSQVYTATVIDEFGNPVPNVTVNFTKTGPGSFNGASSASAVTNSQGTASVTLTTAASDSGSGTVTADITATSGFNQCGQPAGESTTNGTNHVADANAKTAGNCTATDSYTVAPPPPPPAAGSLPAYRSGSGNFFRDSLTSGAPTSSFGFGNSGDTPLWGDWNGDGTPSIGVYRPSNRTFYLSNDNKTAAIVVTIGNTGDLPVAGDFDGNGTTSIGLFRPSTGTWYITNNDHSVASSFVYGTKGDRPIVGDWTGQGVSKAGVYRPSTATFYRIGHAGIRFGNVGDTGVVGDWDANGTTTIGVVRGTTWYVSNNNSSAATSFSYGTTGARFFTWSKTAGSSAPTSS